MKTRISKNPVMRNLLTALVVAGSLFSGATYAQDDADEPNEANMIEVRHHDISGQRCWDVVTCHVNCFYEEDGSEDCFARCTEDVSDSAITHWGGIADCSSENSCQTHPQDFSGEAIDCINQNCDPQLGACWHDVGQNDVGEDDLCNEGEQLLGTDFVSGDPCTEQHGPEGREYCNDPEYCGDPENCGACAYDEESDHCFTGDADQNASNEQVVAYCLVDAVACAEPLAAADASDSARNDAVAEKQSCETDKASIEAAKVAAVAEKASAVADKARCATELSASQTAKTDALAANQSCETDKASIEAARVAAVTEKAAAVTERDTAIAEKAQCVTERDAALAERARCATELDPAQAAAGTLDMTTHYLKIDGSIGTAMPLTSCIEDQEFQSAPPTPVTDRVCQSLTTCDGANTYETAAPTTTSDRVCQNQPDCAEWEVVSVPGTPTTPLQCGNACSSDEYYQMNNEYPVGSCAAALLCMKRCPDGDRYCEDDCTRGVGSGRNGPYRYDEGELLGSLMYSGCWDDRAGIKGLFTEEAIRCVNDAGYDARDRYMDPRAIEAYYTCRVSDVMASPAIAPPVGCQPISQCPDTQYQISGPTLSRDRKCIDHPVCTDDQYEVRAATRNYARVCQDLTTCPSAQIEVKKATATTDRVCGNICDSTEWWDGKKCKPLTQCADGQVAMVAATLTSDRECGSCMHDRVRDYSRPHSEGGVEHHQCVENAACCVAAGGWMSQDGWNMCHGVGGIRFTTCPSP